MKALKILHVIPSVARYHGGPSRAIVAMELALGDASEVTTLTTDDDGPGRRFPSSDRPSGAGGATRVYRRKWLEFYKVAPGLLPWLWQNVRTFDVVHIHALFSFSSSCAAIVARLRGVPYIIRPLGTLAAYGVGQRRAGLKKISFAMLEGPIIRHAAAVHFTSESEREEATLLGVDFRSAVIPLGVESPTELRPRARPDLPPGILFLSRVDPKKNLDVLLRSIALLPGAHGAARLIIAGDGAPLYRAELRALADELGIADRILWLGHVDGQAKAQAFADADIFVLPSKSENFGIAAAEAMLSGLPCVLSTGVAIASDTAAAGGAIVVAPEPGALAAGLSELLGDPERRQRMGAAARRHAAAAYSTDAMARQLIALYVSVRKAPKGGPASMEPR